MSELTTIKQEHKQEIVNVALDTIRIDKQAIIFVNTKRSAEKCAEDISRKQKRSNPEWNALSEDILNILSKPTKQCERLSRCLKKGVAFHHSGLTSKQREIVENGFRNGVIRIICSTPTLAAGLDMPAYRVIIRDMKRFSDTGWTGMNYIPVLEYLQMAGRAGRPKFEKIGESIIISPDEKEKEHLKETYIYGYPESITSKLAVEPVLRTYILSLIATGFVNNRKDLLDFFSETFWAHQFNDMFELEKKIDRMIHLLAEFKFVITARKDDDFTSASEISDDSLKTTSLGKRVAELYIDPLTANHIIKGLERSETKIITSFGLLQLICNTREMQPSLKVRNKEIEEITGKFLEHSDNVLEPEPPMFDTEYDYYLNSVKTAFFLEDWIKENDEEFLLEKYDVRPGETRMKIEKADWVLFSASELARILKKHNILKEILKLRLRLKYGVKEELLTLLKLKNIGRVRARKLFSQGIKDIGAIKSSSITSLAQLLGKALALDVKKQVGEDISGMKVPEKKRKGQISLNDF